MFHAQLPFEGNHCFIHAKILTRPIFLSTGFHNRFEERSNFDQFVVIRLTSRYSGFIVAKMKVLCQFIKSVSGHYSLYAGNSKGFVFGPVQRCLGKVVIPEQHVETKECLHFFTACVLPLWVWLSRNALSSITVCFFHDHDKQFIRNKELRKILSSAIFCNSTNSSSSRNEKVLHLRELDHDSIQFRHLHHLLRSLSLRDLLC